jgi:hypothetical protein
LKTVIEFKNMIAQMASNLRIIDSLSKTKKEASEKKIEALQVHCRSRRSGLMEECRYR